MYEIRPAGVKGLGVFAKQLIPRGTRIFSERPLLNITHSGNGAGAGAVLKGLGALTLIQRKALLGLSGHSPGKDLVFLRWGQVAWYRTIESFATIKSRFNAQSHLVSEHGVEEGRQSPKRGLALNIREHLSLLNIFRSNNFNIGLNRQAVFSRISRLNHSCIPNAQGNFHEDMEKFNIHATRDIAADEEVLISYLKEPVVSLLKQRQERLLEGYGFECDCPACDTSLKRGQDGEAKRQDLLNRLAAYMDAEEGKDPTTQDGMRAQLETLVAIAEVFEGEGITGRELSNL